MTSFPFQNIIKINDPAEQNSQQTLINKVLSNNIKIIFSLKYISTAEKQETLLDKIGSSPGNVKD